MCCCLKEYMTWVDELTSDQKPLYILYDSIILDPRNSEAFGSRDLWINYELYIYPRDSMYDIFNL